jgi:hypothetical protein
MLNRSGRRRFIICFFFVQAVLRATYAIIALAIMVATISRARLFLVLLKPTLVFAFLDELGRFVEILEPVRIVSIAHIRA